MQIDVNNFDIDDINFDLKVNNNNFQVIDKCDEYHDLFELVDNNNNVIKVAEFIDELLEGVV
jgi:hypothetical protein